MTIIAAIHDPKEKVTYIGSDTQATPNGRKHYFGFKFVRIGGWAFGVAGDVLTVTTIEAEAERLAAEYAGNITTLCAEIRHSLRAADFGVFTSCGGPMQYAQSCILANAEGVNILTDCLAPIAIPHGTIGAHGSGCGYAYGASFAALSLGASPREALDVALNAALKYDSHCGGEIIVEELR